MSQYHEKLDSIGFGRRGVPIASRLAKAASKLFACAVRRDIPVEIGRNAAMVAASPAEVVPGVGEVPGTNITGEGGERRVWGGPPVPRRIDVGDFAVGLLLIATALLAAYLAWPLRVGTAFRMGPGYVPLLLCGLQITLGLVIVGFSIVGRSEPVDAWAARPIIWILASVTFFSVAVERFGLLVAVAGLVLLSGPADRANRFWEAAFMGIALAVISALVFVLGLKLPLPLLPGFVSR